MVTAGAPARAKGLNEGLHDEVLLICMVCMKCRRHVTTPNGQGSAKGSVMGPHQFTYIDIDMYTLAGRVYEALWPTAAPSANGSAAPSILLAARLP